MVEVRHAKNGNVEKISERVWKDWGSAKAKDNDIRHGYVLERTFEVDAKGKELASVPGPKAKGETFKPTFTDQGQSNGAKAAEQTAAPKPSPVAPPAQPVQQSRPQGKPDNLVAIPSVGTKVQEALNAAGIRTYKELLAAEDEAIGKVLDGMVPPMTPKRAQIPAWKKAAAEFVKAAEEPMQ